MSLYPCGPQEDRTEALCTGIRIALCFDALKAWHAALAASPAELNALEARLEAGPTRGERAREQARAVEEARESLGYGDTDKGSWFYGDGR